MAAELTSQQEKILAAATRGNTDDLDFLISSEPTDKAKEELLYIRRPADGWSLLHVAAYYGQVGFMKHLVEKYNFKFNDMKTNMGGVALHKAAVGGRLNSSVYLVSIGQPADAANDSGWTPFLECAIHNNLECARFFAKHGANVNQQDRYGKTSLHYAVQGGHVEFVEFLLSLNADGKLKTNHGETAFSLATAKSASLPALKALLPKLQPEEST